MKYEEWRNELFGLPQDIDLNSVQFSDDFDSILPQEAFDFVDYVLTDQEIHSCFTKEQIGIGINVIFSQHSSALPFLYTIECNEERRVKGIGNLINLYRNYFERYCTDPVIRIGSDQTHLGYICFMFWDIFVLYPGNASPLMISAALDVMQAALDSQNDNCLVSAIHGLGHWAFYTPEASNVLKKWIERPTTKNAAILRYAQVATTGRIM